MYENSGDRAANRSTRDRASRRVVAARHCCGDGLVTEDSAPAAEGQVGGVLFERQVADLVDDDQPVAA